MNTFLVSEVDENSQSSLFILMLDKGAHEGEELAEVLSERYGIACTCSYTRGTIAQTFVDIVFATGRKETYRLDNHVYYNRTQK